MTFNVWYFDDTGEAYNATQTDDRIRNGDVLVVPSERVAGILVEAWPTAVTEAHGHFHRFFKPRPDVYAFPSVSGGGKTYNYAAAIEYAEAFDFDSFLPDTVKFWTPPGFEDFVKGGYSR